MKQGLFAFVVSLVCLVLPGSAFASSEPGNIDLTGASCCKALSLPDSHGVHRQLSDFMGKVVIVSFGFTRCPDICPTTLAELAQSVESLQAKGKDVQVLFVTLDPEHDTGAILSQYVSAFNPSFIALRGSTEETAKAAKDFRVLYKKVPDQGSKNYTIEHTAGVYMFDKAGKARVYVQSVKSANMLPEIRRLLATRNP